MDHRYIAAALTHNDARRVAAVIDQLDGRAPELAIDGVVLDVDSSARHAVVELLRQIATGTSVTIGAVGELLTTSQAAEILGVSDTYVRRLADSGELPIEMRGTHRRFRLEDLVRQREKTKSKQS